MNIKVGIAVVSLLFTSVSPYSYGGNAQSDSQNQGMLCHMPNIAQKHDHQAMMAHNMAGYMAVHNHAAMTQDPGQDQAPAPVQPQQETDAHCERPNTDGSNPDQGGQDPKKVGCMCARKCENGKPSENYDSPEKRCKVHCKPDNCECPNPCKT